MGLRSSSLFFGSFNVGRERICFQSCPSSSIHCLARCRVCLVRRQIGTSRRRRCIISGSLGVRGFFSEFGDFYLSQRTHLSSRYGLTYHGETEWHSSSGVLVATGAGSTGWFSSTQNMAASLNQLLLKERAPKLPRLRLAWDDPRLVFVVREPFRSKGSDVRLTAGLLEPGEELRFESFMPDNGVIFSDGVEADALAFNSGCVARVRAAERRTRLVAS